MNVLDLCSGIGGVALGMQRAGHTIKAFAEVDPYCSAVLKHHWPDVPNLGDITQLYGSDINGLKSTTDIVCAGYPCQPFSLAGGRSGENDDRHIWPHIAFVVDSLEPTFCLFENVAGHVTMGIDAVLHDLEALGYTWETYVIGASATGAPHRRDRVWILAYSRSLGLQGKPDTGDRYATPVQLVTRCSTSGTLDKHLRFTHWAEPQPEIPLVDDGLPRGLARHQLHAIGNAVVPQIAEVFGHMMHLADLDGEG